MDIRSQFRVPWYKTKKKHHKFLNRILTSQLSSTSTLVGQQILLNTFRNGHFGRDLICHPKSIFKAALNEAKFSFYSTVQCTFFIKPFLALATRPFTMTSFTVLAVLFTDCQKRTYVKQNNVALPFTVSSLKCSVDLCLSI